MCTRETSRLTRPAEGPSPACCLAEVSKCKDHKSPGACEEGPAKCDAWKYGHGPRAMAPAWLAESASCKHTFRERRK
eukprot:2489312-Pleurochrysis_carterae.AAC.1